MTLSHLSTINHILHSLLPPSLSQVCCRPWLVVWESLRHLPAAAGATNITHIVSRAHLHSLCPPRPALQSGVSPLLSRLVLLYTRSFPPRLRASDGRVPCHRACLASAAVTDRSRRAGGSKFCARDPEQTFKDWTGGENGGGHGDRRRLPGCSDTRKAAGRDDDRKNTQ